jgi:hypothetical protein
MRSSLLAGAAGLMFLLGCGDDAPGPAPGLQVGSSRVDFGLLQVGQSSVRPLRLTHGGDAAVDLSTPSLVGDVRGAFSVEEAPARLEPGASATLRLRYAPPAVGADTATLVIAEGLSVPVAGTGLAP